MQVQTKKFIKLNSNITLFLISYFQFELVEANYTVTEVINNRARLPSLWHIKATKEPHLVKRQQFSIEDS